MTKSRGIGKGGRREGAGRPPLSATSGRLGGHNVRLSRAQAEQLTRIGGGNLSEGIRRLLARYDTLIGLWQRNVKFSRDALDAARHFGADGEPFEAKLQEATDRLDELRLESDIIQEMTKEAP